MPCPKIAAPVPKFQPSRAQNINSVHGVKFYKWFHRETRSRRRKPAQHEELAQYLPCKHSPSDLLPQLSKCRFIWEARFNTRKRFFFQLKTNLNVRQRNRHFVDRCFKIRRVFESSVWNTTSTSDSICDEWFLSSDKVKIARLSPLHLSLHEIPYIPLFVPERVQFIHGYLHAVYEKLGVSWHDVVLPKRLNEQIIKFLYHVVACTGWKLVIANYAWTKKNPKKNQTKTKEMVLILQNHTVLSWFTQK